MKRAATVQDALRGLRLALPTPNGTVGRIDEFVPFVEAAFLQHASGSGWPGQRMSDDDTDVTKTKGVTNECANRFRGVTVILVSRGDGVSEFDSTIVRGTFEADETDDFSGGIEHDQAGSPPGAIAIGGSAHGFKRSGQRPVKRAEFGGDLDSCNQGERLRTADQRLEPCTVGWKDGKPRGMEWAVTGHGRTGSRSEHIKATRRGGYMKK
jgi:hypothetical protein